MMAALFYGCFELNRYPGGAFDAENYTSHPVSFGNAEIFAEYLILKAPRGISVDFQGNVYVCDTGSHRILKLSPEGEILQERGGFGSGFGRFNLPTDINAKNGIDIFVVDSHNSRILRYDSILNFVSEVGLTGDFGQIAQARGRFYGIAVSENGDLFVSDVDRSFVIKVDVFGRNINLFGDARAGQGRLLFPMGLDVDENNHVV